MKKNTLTTAVVASLAGVAGIANISSAVNLNPDGLGQVLIYPYYTVNNNNQTLISVVNTTNLGKAVKVRVLEGRNSREVLDFNLYLSPFDVWTAAIFATGVGVEQPGNITTNDTSCTSPIIKGGAGAGLVVPFRNFRYTGDNNDSGQNTLDRTREGYIEMIEMGTVLADTVTSKRITHVLGTPPGCVALDDDWADNNFYDNDRDITVPSGGLFGGGALVNSGDGTFINYNADAIDGFFTVAPTPGVPSALHTAPGEILPTLSFANNGGGVATSFVFDNGRLIRSNWNASTTTGATDLAGGSGVDAVSAVFMSNNLMNEFSTEAAIAGQSEWVVTFPTKRFYVDRQFNVNAPTQPFTVAFGAANNAEQADAGACEPLGFTIYDREERTGGRGRTDFSPQPPGQAANSLCYESQVITFNQTGGASRIFGSNLVRNINPTASGTLVDAGWMNINFSAVAGTAGAVTGVTRRTRPSRVDGHRFEGLPATGFWAWSIENRNARPGVQGFYGGAYNHRRTRSCVSGAVNNLACVSTL